MADPKIFFSEELDMIANTSIDIKTLGHHVKARKMIFCLFQCNSNTEIIPPFSALSSAWESLPDWSVPSLCGKKSKTT
jgi:hypothetical protein